MTLSEGTYLDGTIPLNNTSEKIFEVMALAEGQVTNDVTSFAR